MEICPLLLVTLCSLHQSVSEYHRHKPRGPPGPSPHLQYVKWQQQQQQHHHFPQRRPSNRSRPTAVLMPPMHNIPIDLQSSPSRPIVAPPVRAFWKKTEATFRTNIPEKPQFSIKNDEQQFSSPKVIAQEYDIHIQTNSIPTHTNPIEQVGEKGPIHTIPAPNLSPADRPANIENVRSVHQTAYLSDQQAHQYHVTESPEFAIKHKPYRVQQIIQFSQDSQAQTLQDAGSGLHAYGLNSLNQQQTSPLPQELYFNLQDNSHISPLNSEDIYQIHSDYSHAQELTSISAGVNQELLRKLPNYQALISQNPQLSSHEPQLQSRQPQLFQPQHNYIQQIHERQQQQQILKEQQRLQQQQQLPQQQQLHQKRLLHQQKEERYKQQHQYRIQEQEALDKISKQPELHSFDYNEHDYQKQNSQNFKLSSLVSAGYNLDSEVIASEVVHQTIARSPLDSLARSQYVKNYFSTKGESIASNDVGPDAKPSFNESSDGTRDDEKISSDSFYAFLPNKETADVLASLQAAGKVNNHLMHSSNNEPHVKSEMSIYVPDDEDEGESMFEDPERNSENQNNVGDIDNTSEVDDDGENLEQIGTSFGDKIKPKNNNY